MNSTNGSNPLLQVGNALNGVCLTGESSNGAGILTNKTVCPQAIDSCSVVSSIGMVIYYSKQRSFYVLTLLVLFEIESDQSNLDR